jgi:hypothetical protein
MQKTKPDGVPKRRIISFFAALIGTLGFLFSLVLALHMVWVQGNPAFVVIWLVAAGVVAACLRLNRKWLATFERIWAMKVSETVFPMRRKWGAEVEDVIYRDLPDKPVSFGP